MTPQDFINTIAPAARQMAATTGIPASFTVAQAALESGWGASELAQKYHNLFGVKADASWHGPTVFLPTKERINGKDVVVSAPWRIYPDWLSSLQDRAQFLLTNPRYKPMFACTSGCDFAVAVQKAGYATDPDYASKIVAIIRGRNLQTLDSPAA